MVNKQDFIDSIPFEDLFQEIREITNIPELEFTYEVKDYGSDIYVYFSSQNIIGLTHSVVDLMYDELVIKQSYSTRIFLERRYGYFGFSGGVEFDGTREFLSFIYTEKDGWKFIF